MIRLLLFILTTGIALGQTYTEFYVQTTGSNLNAGSTTGDAAVHTYPSGSWVASTGVFTVASGAPSTDVAVGDFASVYADGSTQTGFVGRVTARDATTITVSLSAESGTPPTDGTGNRTLKIGGAWAGPNGTSLFPFGFLAPAATDASGNPPRANFKAQTYNVTAGGTITFDGAVFYEGYSTTPGDDAGRATIDGGATGTAYTILDLADGTADAHHFENFIFQNNGNSGTTTTPLVETGQGTFFMNCIFRNSYGKGLRNAQEFIIYECEATNNFLSNTGSTSIGGFHFNFSGTLAMRCYSHDNLKDGLSTDGGVLIVRCISESNGGDGAGSTGDENLFLFQCDFYNNTVDGYSLGDGSGDPMQCFVMNNNFVLNGRYGWRTGTQETPGLSINNGFGTGTAANVSGNFQYDKWWLTVGNVSYPSNQLPYEDGPAGDFRITLAEAAGAGFGAFLQTASGYTGTVGYPSIGAQQQ